MQLPHLVIFSHMYLRLILSLPPHLEKLKYLPVYGVSKDEEKSFVGFKGRVKFDEKWISRLREVDG